MVMDATEPDFNPNEISYEPPNPEAQKFFDMLSTVNKELWPGCQRHLQLSLVARMLNMKAEHHMSQREFDDIAQLIKEVAPDENRVTENFYSAKRLVRGLGLPVEKIHYCNNGCMLFWGEDVQLTICKICGHQRYKRPTRAETNTRRKTNVPYKKMYYFPLSPRLLRLYASKANANDMRWHAEQEVVEGEMQHCSDSIAWKHFNTVHPDLAVENRNERLGLCTYGFQPFWQSGQQYSSWPVILTIYNLLPWLCMKETYMFLTVLVPGPKNPKHKLDIFFQPLIAELKELWDVGILAYDISTYCMGHSEAFTLSKSGKQSWFDTHRKFLPADHIFRRNRYAFRKNMMVTATTPPILRGNEILHLITNLGLKKVTEVGASDINDPICKGHGWKKRSIFWDFPYWSTLLIRHNLDVMHIEKNVFDNVFNTVMNVPGKTKDTSKSRQELNEYCRHPELEKAEGMTKYPKAFYTLDKN